VVKLSHPAALAAGLRSAGLFTGQRAPIRPATFADRPALAVLAAAAFAQGAAALAPAGSRARADAVRFEALFSTGAPLLMAELEGAPLGCILAEALPVAGGAARLTGLWVSPAAAGKGIGSALLCAMEALLLAEGQTDLRVRVPSGHLRALGLFRHRGYAMQAAGLRMEPVLQMMLPQTVLAKGLVAPAAPLAA
jgi:ribosomal protein S18 acetylase RimI-like enzyme